MAVVLFIVIFTSITSGRQSAEAEAILQTVGNLKVGLELFEKDQDRFPSFEEFNSQDIMLNYFSSFPPKNFVSKNCTENFVYKRLSQKNYQLSFCLPRKSGNFNKGWSTINEQG